MPGGNWISNDLIQRLFYSTTIIVRHKRIRCRFFSMEAYKEIESQCV